jgi:iron(III) transport system permease protein
MKARRELVGWALAALLAWMVVYPLAIVGVGGVEDEGGLTTRWIRAFLDRPNEWSALWGSLWISLATVVLAALIGVPLAFLFTRVEFPGRRFLGALVALPAVLPPLVGAVAFLFLFGETGFLAHVVQWATRSDAPPWRFQGAPAILIIHAYTMYVYFYLFVRAGLAQLDGSMLEASASLGAGRVRTLVRVVLPLLRPALLGAALLVFLSSLASFSAPYIFGGSFRVMSTQIVRTRLNGDDRLAMVETAVLALVALAALWWARRLEGRAATGGAKGAAPRRAAVTRPGARAAITGLAWLVAGLSLLPHATLLLVSFVPRGTWTTQVLPPEYTLQNYVSLVADPTRLRPLLTSGWMAAVATLAAVAIGLVFGVAVVRWRARSATLLQWLVALPWAVPGTVFAIALATAFSVDRPWVLRFLLVGTPVILPLAYLIRNVPIAGRAILAGYQSLDPSYEQAAASLGAGAWRRLRRVVLPLLRPAIVAGGTLAFVAALGDFMTSVLLYTYDTRPISLEIMGSLWQSDVGVSAAYGMVLMVVSAAVFLLTAEHEAPR